MAWILEENERDALAAVSLDRFRQRVITHTRRKASLRPELSVSDFDKVAQMLFERVHALLGRYKTASYDSYVLMMLVYFGRGIDQVEGRDMQASLRNDRFGINTRVRVSYDLMKVFMQEGL